MEISSISDIYFLIFKFLLETIAFVKI